MLVTAQHGFHNKLYFFRAFLSYLYLLSFALSEDFLYRADVIYPIQFFLHVIGIPAWALPVPYAVACSGGSVGIRIQQRACSGYYICLALCGLTLLAVVVIGFAIAHGMSNGVDVAIGMAQRTGTRDPVGRCRAGEHRSRSIDRAASAPTATYGAGRFGSLRQPRVPMGHHIASFLIGTDEDILAHLHPRVLGAPPPLPPPVPQGSRDGWNAEIVLPPK